MSSAPTPPTTTRQRSNYAAKVEDEPEHETENPASLSPNMSKKVPRNKPHVKPPFIDVPMNRFLVYLVLGLFSVMAFYGWRFTVYAHDVGGYWNLITGHRTTAADAAATAANAAATAAANHVKSNPSAKGSSQQDIQSQIYNLALALGIKPAELSNAIRPLIDPSVPNPAAAQATLEAGAQASASAAAHDGPGFLGIVSEALLD